MERASEKEDEKAVKREFLTADDSDEDVTLCTGNVRRHYFHRQNEVIKYCQNLGNLGLAVMINDDVIPSRLEEVLLLMDFLFDCEDEDLYHQRLWTNGSLDGLRKGISTRQKLRKVKAKNPGHPAVSWQIGVDASDEGCAGTFHSWLKDM